MHFMINIWSLDSLYWVEYSSIIKIGPLHITRPTYNGPKQLSGHVCLAFKTDLL